MFAHCTRAITTLIIATLLPAAAIGADLGEDARGAAEEVRLLEQDLKQQTLALLVLLKRVETPPAAKAPGTRGVRATPSAADRQLLKLAAELVDEIDAGQTAAAAALARFDAAYGKLVGTERTLLAPVQRQVESDRASLARYRSHLRRFYGPYAQLARMPVATGRQPLGVRGNVTAQIGVSSYKSGDAEASQVSRELGFAGTKLLDERSELELEFKHRAEIIRTAHNTNMVRVGHSLRGPSTSLKSHFSYQAYNDSLDQNDYGHLGLGAKLQHTFNPRSHGFAELQLNNRSYDQAGGNEYTGVQFDTGWRRKPSAKSQLTIGLAGVAQGSDVPILDFTRLRPHLDYRRSASSGSFRTQFEFEQLAYDSAAELSDYSRERLAVTWARPHGQRQMYIAAKQFPHHEQSSYVKLGGSLAARRTSGPSPANSKLSMLVVLFPQGGDSQVPYGDIRYDYHRSHPLRSLNLSVFGRIWGSTDSSVVRDHVIDLYGSYVWQRTDIRIGALDKINLRVGPLIGMHLLFHPDEDFPRRDGNSFRVGFEAIAGTRVKLVELDLRLRHERDVVYADQILSIDENTGATAIGDVTTRTPGSTQIGLDLQVPLMPEFAYSFSLNYYRVSYDQQDVAGLNTIDRQTELTVLTGFRYDFAL